MKLAKKILEAVSDKFISDLKSWATVADREANKIADKDAKKVAKLLVSIAFSIEEKDEKGALADIKKLTEEVKKLNIED